MKIYLPCVTDVHFYNDGWTRVDIKVVAEKEKIGFDEGGLWFYIDEENVEEMRRLRAQMRFYDNEYSNTIINKAVVDENQ